MGGVQSSLRDGEKRPRREVEAGGFRRFIRSDSMEATAGMEADDRTQTYFTNVMIPKDAGWWKVPFGPGKGLQDMKRLCVSSPGPSAR